MTDLDTFRQQTSDWLEENCPQTMRARTFHWEDAQEILGSEDARRWRKAMADRGWTAPTWPAEYGGGGLAPGEARVLAEEMARIKAVDDRPDLAGIWHRGAKAAPYPQNH
jgi:acyl-CoA dehydrogenase